MLLIKGGRVIDLESSLDQIADVLVDGKKIIKIADSIEEVGAEITDATGLVVTPGLVGAHVHFREPGQTHKEDICTGALTAAAGGFTSVVIMTNTNPTISNVKTLKKILASAAKEDVHIYTNTAVAKNFGGQHLTDFKALLEDGALSFSDDGIPLQNTKVLKEALNLAKASNTFVTVHEEDPKLNGILGLNGHIARGKFHFCGATDVAEHSMVARDVTTAYNRDTHLRIQHLSKAESAKVVEFAQQPGADVTAEAAPQHFSKAEDLLLIKSSATKMDPPLRIRKDRLAVVGGSKSGAISVIATDHTPHHVDEKNVDDITRAPSGMIGLETSLSLDLTNLATTSDLTLSELLTRMTINPSSMYDFDAGYLAENGPTDVVIFTGREERIISDHSTSKASNSPFIGEKLQGVVKYTICNSKIVYQAS